MKMSEYATELEYLRWFFDNCDFGPGHEDVIEIMNENFKKETKKEVPTQYRY